MSEFEFEREDVLPYMETGFDEKVRKVVERMLREPATLPQEYKTWLPSYIETANVQVPKSQVIGFASAEVPVGVICAYVAATAPTGWILCDGSAVSRSDQALLFAAIGTTYGAGDGSSTFNVPNLKGSVPVGLDSAQTEFNALAETGGTKTHTLTTAQMPAHVHTGPIHQHSTNDIGPVLADPTAPANNVIQYGAGGGLTGSAGGGNTGSTGSGNSHNNLQPYLVVNFIIKAV